MAAFAPVVVLGVFDVVARERGDDIEIVGQAGLAFQLEALGAHGAGLLAEVGVQQIGGEHVLLVDLVDRHLDETVLPRRLVLDSGLVLLAGGRLEGLVAFVHVQPADRLERLGVADIGHDAVAELVAEAGAAAELLVLRVDLAAGFLGVGLGPVIASAEGQEPLVPFHLVLQVDSGLVGGAVPAIGIGEGELAAVHRLVQIDDRGGFLVRVETEELGFEVVVVNTDQRGVIDRAGLEFGLGHVVHAEGLVGLRPVHAIARGIASVIGTGVRVGYESVTVQWRHVLVVEIGVAGVLLEGPDIVEFVAELIAEHELVAVVGVQPRLADEGAALDPPVGRTEHRAVGRQALGLGHVVVLLVLAVEGQAGLLVGVPGKARRQHEAFLLGIVDLRVDVPAHTGQPVQVGALFIERAADVEGAVAAVLAAAAEHHFADRGGGGTLGHHVDDAARFVLAVEHRCRPLQHFDAFQGIGVDLQGTAGTAAAVGHVQAVEVHRRRAEAARGRLVEDLHPVGEAAAGDPRSVAQGLGDGLRTARLDLVLGDHVDGLGDFLERGVGLGAGTAALGHVAVDVAPGRLLAGDGNVAEVHRVRRALGADGNAGALQAVAGAGTAEKFGESRLDAQLAADRVAAQALHFIGAVKHLQLALLAELAQGAGQGLGADVELDLLRFGLAGDGRQQGHGQGGGAQARMQRQGVAHH